MSHTPYLYPAFYVPTYVHTRTVEKYWVHTGEFYTDHEVVVKPVARIKKGIKGILPSVPSYSKKAEVRHHDTPISVEDFNTNGTAYNRGRYTTNVNYQSCPQASWLVNGTWFGSVNAEGVDYTDNRMTGTFLSVDGDVWTIPTIETIERCSQSLSYNGYSRGKAEYCSDYYDQYQYDDSGDCLYDDDMVFTREQGEEDEYCYY